MDRDAIAKNLYYRDGFRNMARIVNVQAAVIVLLVLLLAFHVYTSKNQDQFFAQTLEGKKMQVPGLYFPNMGKTSLRTWVAQAATQIMTFGFNDVDERFNESRQNFTPAGWESFRTAVIKSGLVDSVIAAQQIISAIPKDTPVLLQEGLIEGVYSWVFEMPLLITVRAGGVHQVVAKRLRVVIEQVPTSANPAGVGIGAWYMY